MKPARVENDRGNNYKRLEQRIDKALLNGVQAHTWGVINQTIRLINWDLRRQLDEDDLNETA